MKAHNWMATADGAVRVFVKGFHWDQGPQPVQKNLTHL